MCGGAWGRESLLSRLPTSPGRDADRSGHTAHGRLPQPQPLPVGRSELLVMESRVPIGWAPEADDKLSRNASGSPTQASRPRVGSGEERVVVESACWVGPRAEQTRPLFRVHLALPLGTCWEGLVLETWPRAQEMSRRGSGRFWGRKRVPWR